nr:hypothetical protein CFP56_21618 [Quercus suber]
MHPPQRSRGPARGFCQDDGTSNDDDNGGTSAITALSARPDRAEFFRVKFALCELEAVAMLAFVACHPARCTRNDRQWNRA